MSFVAIQNLSKTCNNNIYIPLSAKALFKKRLSSYIFSSFKRSGPVALFTKLNADFYIVDTEVDPECGIWKEKAYQMGPTYYQSLRTTIPENGLVAGHKHPQGYYAVKCDEVDWGKYDIVISMDISVPARITPKYPLTLWAYYVGEGGQPSHRASLRQPIKGYDCFLTQDFAEHPVCRPHVIEFPYHLNYYGCFHELFS